MGKYASWNEFEKNVPITYKEKATPEAYRTGMNGIAPVRSQGQRGTGQALRRWCGWEG